MKQLECSGAIPKEKGYHSAVINEDSMFVFGGYGNKARNDFHEFKIKDKSWQVITPTENTPSARYCFSFFNINKELYIFGGEHSYGNSKKDCYRYDFKSGDWNELKLMNKKIQKKLSRQTTTVVS